MTVPTAFGPQGPNFSLTRPAFGPDVSQGVDTWAQDCSKPGAKDGTYFTAEFFNVVIANLRQACRTAGVTLDKTDDLMLYKAISNSSWIIVGTDNGGANTIVIPSPSPTVTALRQGLVLVCTPAALNTGATTIDIGNFVARPVIYPNGSAFLGGEMQPRPQVFIYDGVSWEWQGQQSPILQQATTFYVSPGGVDTNNGLTPATPLRNIQAAANRTALFNLNGFNVTIKLADGGYVGPVTLPAISGSGSVSIIGNVATPGNIILNSNTQGFVGAGPGNYTISGLRVITIGNSFQMGAGQTLTLQNIDYGPCSASHISIDGGALFMTGQHSISGSAQAHVSGINGATLRSIPGAYPTLNVLFGVSFPSGFITSNTFANLSLVYGGIAGAANVTNTKKFVTATGIINTLSRGINYYPGDIPGTSVNSWEYQ